MGIKSFFKKRKRKRNKEFSKRLLSRIINHAILMMWASYILAWFDKIKIAESLSKTVATAIVGVTIPYLATKTIENVNKYGSRLNNTSVGDTSFESSEEQSDI